MNRIEQLKRYKTELLFYFGLLTILGIAFFIQSIYVDSMWSSGDEKPTRDLIINVFFDRLVAAYIWLLLTPFIILAAERIASRQYRLFATIALHIVTGLFFTFIHIPLYSSFIFVTHSAIPWMYAAAFEKTQDVSYLQYVLSSFGKLNHVYRLLYYCIIIAIHFAFDYFRKYSEKELRTSQLEVQLKEAQIRTLHQQLQPHFLFNTLNGISSLMYKNIDDADKMLTYLGDLLRISLERMNIPEVPLKDDIAFIERYLLIEKTRMGDRLTVKTNFHPDTLDALVPCMLVQPLLENAVIHGISPNPRGGGITVTSWRHAEKLFFQIENSGNGPKVDVANITQKGYGIKNTIERLTYLYNKNFSLDFSSNEGGGLCVTLSIPFRMQTE